MKKILLIISLFLLTGCTANYKLTYKNEIFNESLDVISDSNLEMDGNMYLNDSINNYYNNINLSTSYKSDSGDEESVNNKYYNKMLIDNGLNLNYNFNNKNDYRNSSIVHGLFNEFYVTDNYIFTSKIKSLFTYYKSLNKVNIIFETDKNVLNSNADKVIDNVYYWYFTKDNYQNKHINISLSNMDEKEEFIKDGYLTVNVFKYILMIFIIIFLISIIIIYEKVKKSNK